MKKIAMSLTLGLTILLCGCGGGGGDSEEEIMNTVSVDIFSLIPAINNTMGFVINVNFDYIN